MASNLDDIIGNFFSSSHPWFVSNISVIIHQQEQTNMYFQAYFRSTVDSNPNTRNHSSNFQCIDHFMCMENSAGQMLFFVPTGGKYNIRFRMFNFLQIKSFLLEFCVTVLQLYLFKLLKSFTIFST